jgi:mercuric ion binding protein
MVCAYCAQGLERTLARRAEVSSIEVRLASHDAVVRYREGMALGEAELRRAAREAGLGVEKVEAL